MGNPHWGKYSEGRADRTYKPAHTMWWMKLNSGTFAETVGSNDMFLRRLWLTVLDESLEELVAQNLAGRSERKEVIIAQEFQFINSEFCRTICECIEVDYEAYKEIAYEYFKGTKTKLSNLFWITQARAEVYRAIRRKRVSLSVLNDVASEMSKAERGARKCPKWMQRFTAYPAVTAFRMRTSADGLHLQYGR